MNGADVGPILALETSCDETSAAVVHGTRVLSNVVASQIEMHAQWGGVVPEAAARAHVQSLLPVLSTALDQARMSLEGLSAIAVTNRPGLIGALSVGVTAAKGLAYTHRKPLLGVHHIEGHLASVLPLHPEFPIVTLVVSGGHSELLFLESPTRYRLLGSTRDDAAGEALDKSARLLGLPYPGGKRLSEIAREGDPRRYDLPKGLRSERYDMSFSGLKTAVLRTVEREGEHLVPVDLAASVQKAVVDALLIRVEHAIDDYAPRGIAVVGGVAANWLLRDRLAELAAKRNVHVYIPPFDLCTDNAGMIGLAAVPRLAAGEKDGMDLESRATSPLPGLIIEEGRDELEST